MRVQFLVDFRGKLTRENYYTAGMVVEFDDVTALALIGEERAVALADPAPEPAPASPKPAPRKQRQSSRGVL